MIGLGINTMVWSGGYEERQLGLLKRIRDWGYDVVELPVFDFAAVDPAPVRHALADTGLALTVTSAMPAGLTVVSRGRRDAGRAHGTGCRRPWRKSRPWADPFLPDRCICRSGRLPGRRRTDSEWSWALDEYRLLAAESAKRHTHCPGAAQSV